MEPLTGVLSQVDVPESCPTCGAEVESGAFGEMRVIEEDDDGMILAEQGSFVLRPCGHSLGYR